MQKQSNSEESVIRKEAGFAFRFAIVGVVNTIVGSSIMFGLYNLADWSYWLASAANFTLTSVLSFFLNRRFTFKHKGNIGRSALKFAVNIAVCYVLAFGIARPLIRWALAGFGANVQDNIAMIAGLCFFTLFNYLGQRLFAFRKQSTNSIER